MLILTNAPTEERDEVVKEEFYSSLEKVCEAAPNEDMKTIYGTSTLKLEKSPIYITHVKATAFTTKQMITENIWQFLYREGI